MAKANFRRGAEAAAEATKGGGFARTQYLRLKDGDEAIVRFLTDADEWITVDQHSMVPTKPEPDDFKGDNWPEKMGSVCRNDEAFSGLFDDCYICEFLVDDKKVKKPSARVWALACVREEVFEDGKKIGVRDKTREVTIPEREDEDGKKRPEETRVEKDIVVVNQGYRNFFGILQGFAGRYGTVLDRDYYIKRVGGGTDTEYRIAPEDPIDTNVGTADKPEVIRFDLRDTEHFGDRYPTDIDLGEVVTEQASDDYYARFFDPRVEVDDEGEVKDTGKEPESETEMTAERLEALSSRVRSHAGEAASESDGEPKSEEPDKAEEKEAAAVQDLG